MNQATFCLTNVDHCCWLRPLFFDILVLGFRLRSPPLLYASVYCVSEVSSNVKQIMSDLVEGPTQEALSDPLCVHMNCAKTIHDPYVKRTWTVHEVHMTCKLPTFHRCFVLQQTSNTDPKVGQHLFSEPGFSTCESHAWFFMELLGHDNPYSEKSCS
jgi:hypothetical protein